MNTRKMTLEWGDPEPPGSDDLRTLSSGFRRGPIRRLEPGCYRGRAVVFFTLVTHHRQPLFRNIAAGQDVLMTILTRARNANVLVRCAVVMPDHVHVLAAGQSDESNLLTFIANVKRDSSRLLGRQKITRPWQRGFYDHVLRPNETTDAYEYYILQNVVTAGLAQNWTEYPLAILNPWPPQN